MNEICKLRWSQIKNKIKCTDEKTPRGNESPNSQPLPFNIDVLLPHWFLITASPLRESDAVQVLLSPFDFVSMTAFLFVENLPVYAQYLRDFE